jgi:hypothetical protein
MKNNLGQPEISDVVTFFCDSCNAVQCAGCPVNEILQNEKQITALTAERDEAVRNANTYRARVMEFMDGMLAESLITQDTEERRGLDPEYREQYRKAIEYIKKALSNHNYAKEAEVAGVFASLVAGGEYTAYKSGADLIAAAKK